MKVVKRPVVIAALALACASLFCEWMRVRYEEAQLQTHQSRWDCWAAESRKVARCVELSKENPVDADFCVEAVLACRANGAEAAVERADEGQSTWLRLAAVFRLTWMLAAIGCLLHLIARRVARPRADRFHSSDRS